MFQDSNSFQPVSDWVDTMRPHWIRCQGNVHNDPKFWNECIHSQDKIWISAIDFYCEVRGIDADIDRKHPHLNEDLSIIAQRIDQKKDITIPFNKTGYNKPVFRATMALKDVFSKLTGRPMQDHLAAPKPKKAKPSRDELMAQYAKLGKMIEDLFE